MKLLKPIQNALSGMMLLVSSAIWGQSEKPNIVFILADDLGWADLPIYGNKFNEAPNLTKLARDGMLFTNAYASSPVCSPTRASIMSGQYPARVGIIDWIPGHWRPFEEVTVPVNRTQYLPEEIVTMGEALKSAGYATGYFGKWHLGNKRTYHPLNQGFDIANIGQGYYGTRFDPPRQDSGNKIIAEQLTDFGIDFIEKNKKNPFFLFIAHWNVHCPFDSDQKLIDKYLKKESVEDYPCNAVYAAMIEDMDTNVGRLLDKLEKAGLSDHTVVIFYSDNGGVISENQYPGIGQNKMPMLIPSKSQLYEDSPLQFIASSNAPLSGEKGTVREGGIRESLLIKWPGKITAGSVCDAVVTSVDFYPTLLEIIGEQIPGTRTLDGISILPALLTNEYDPERPVYWHYPVYHHDVPASAIRKGDWKLIENLITGNATLYNLKYDIGETTDLSKVFPEKTEDLYSLLKAWQEDVGAEFPKPNPDFNPAKRFEWGKHPALVK
ncbi:MAG: sulfatase [Mangrovibacterium sp.]